MTRKNDQRNFTRREFMSAAGKVGLGSFAALAAGAAQADSAAAPQESQGTTTSSLTLPPGAHIPTRQFGKTGVKVSILSMGGMFDIPNNQLLLKKCLDLGATYWDTAAGYEGGNSEIGIGTFLEKFPDERKKIFLVTKGGKKTPAGLSELLAQSLQRMKTDHIDLYFMHGVKDPSELSDEMKQWAEKAKAEKKIRFFGFSTHANMESCMIAASKLGWVDGIMTTYNYRVMQSDAMKAAIDACHKAGIGLTAMKTQARGPRGGDDAETMKVIEELAKKGMSFEQAKLKVVWDDERIAAICSRMPNLTILNANAAAAVDTRPFSAAAAMSLHRHALATAGSYCAGCTRLCEHAMKNRSPIGDVMRCLMYQAGYGEPHTARELFAQLQADNRLALASLDYAAAEQACPNGLNIGELMREAAQKLA